MGVFTKTDEILQGNHEIVMEKKRKNEISKTKAYRILELSDRLKNGEVIDKYTAAFRYGVNERSIIRDIKELRDYYDNTVPPIEIVFDRVRKGYVMRPYIQRENDE